MEKERRELGEEEYWRRINERIRLHNEAAMESVREEEERRERVLKEGREMARRKLERLERGEELDDDQAADNDYVVTPPSPDTIRRGNSSFGGPATEFKDVRVRDAQREAAALEDQQRVSITGGKGERREGEGNIPLKYLQEEERMDESDCTPYEEDEEDEGEREREREREREKEKRKSKKEKKRRDSHYQSSPRQADERPSSMDEGK